MNINRYFNSNIYEGKLYSPPIELVAQTLGTLQGQYDKNFSIAQEVKNNFVDSLPQDREQANALQKQYSDMIDKAVSAYGGDYSQAGRELQKTIYQIQKDYGPGGKANAIISNYNNYKQWLTESQDRVKSGKVLGEDLNQANQYFMSNYKGIGELDPTSGSYNQFSPDYLQDYVDPNKIVEDVYKEFKPQKYKVSRTEFKNGLQTDVTQEYEGITPDRLYSSFGTALDSNPAFRQYLAQKGKFAGISNEDQNAFVDNYAKTRAQDLSYMNRSDLSKSERDPLLLMQQKEALRHKYKMAEQNDLMGQFKTMFQYEPTTDITTRKQADLNPDNWRNSGLSSVPWDLRSSSIQMGPAQWTEDKGNYKTLLEATKDKGFLDRTSINPQLMKAIIDDEASSLTKDSADSKRVFDQKYGKDKTWTENFDKEVVKRYQTEEASHAKTQPVSIRISSPDARKQIGLELAGQLANPNNVSVLKVGESVPTTAADAGLSSDDLIKDNKMRMDVDIAYALPGKGYAAAGYRVNTKKGSFIILDQDVNRQAMSNELAQGFNPIYFGGKDEGNPIRIGGNVWAKPNLSYVPEDNGTFTERMSYKEVKPDPKTGHWKETGKVYQGNDMDIYNNYLPHFEGALGAGATKKDLTLFRLSGLNDNNTDE